MTKILVADACSHLGKYLLKELDYWSLPAVALVRAPQKLNDLNLANVNFVQIDDSRPETLRGVCADVDTVISTIGIDVHNGLSSNEFVYQANMNILREADRAGVRKFIYVSLKDGDKLRYLRSIQPQERFVDALKTSNLEYCVIRPIGLFSNLREVFNMAKKGRVVLFGNGRSQLNPIHAADLAEVCVQSIALTHKETSVGGPDILTQDEIAEMALSAWNKPADILHLPGWTRLLILITAEIFLPKHRYALFELNLTVMARDSIATRHGNCRLHDYFKQEVLQTKNS